MTLPEKRPPCAIDAEQSVLGALMLDNRQWPDVSERISASDFYREDHRVMFAAMSEMLEAGRMVDIVTLRDFMQERGTLDSAGGFSYLGTLANDTPSAYNAAGYADVVREKSIRRQVIVAGNIAADAGYRCETAAQATDAAQKAVMAIGDATAAELPTDIGDHVGDWLNDLDARRQSPDLPGLSWGLRDLDEKTSGLHPGSLVIVAGRPAMGKTVLALNVADSAARRGEVALFFSLEMPRKDLIDRVMAGRARVPLHRIRDPRTLDVDDLGRLASESGSVRGIIVDDRAGLTVMQIRSRARRVARSKRLAMVVVDYLQLINGTGEENRTRELDAAAQGLKELAKELNIPVVVAAQVGRQVEARGNRRPMMSDLRDCGGIEQAADLIVMLYRPSEYRKDAPEGLAEAIIPKQRNGSTGTVKLAFQGQYCRFCDLDWNDPAREYDDQRVESARSSGGRSGFDYQSARVGGAG